MIIDLLFGLVAVAVIVIVFSARGRQQKATAKSRGDVLHTLAPIVGGTLSDGQLTGTYQGHPVEASLRTTGRVDTIGGDHSTTNTFEVVLLLLHGVAGSNPWGFFTSISPSGSLEHKWRSSIALAGVLGKLFSHVSPIPVDPGIDDRLRQGGMLEALERLGPRDGKAPYIFVSFHPDGAPAIAKTLQRMEAAGVQLAERARHEAAERLKQGGELRIEVERASENDPTPERFRELLDAAMAVARLNASINP